MKYSFVLPAYKARFFKEAIDSILAQTYKDFELIIVNDASPEDLDSIVKSYSDSRIRYYVNEHNIGGKDLVAQWNHSLEYAKGEYVILASDDDVYSPIYLEKMDELVCKYPDVNVFRPRVQRINQRGEICYIEGFLKEYASSLDFISALIHKYIKSGVPYYIFKRKRLLSQGGFMHFPLAWFSDDATVIKLSDNGVVSSSEILFTFRVSGLNISGQRHTKNTLIKKLNATADFYNFMIEYLRGLECNTPIEKYMLSDVKCWFADFIYYDKICPQIYNAPFLSVISVFPVLYRMSFVSKRVLIMSYIKFFLSKLMFWR